jgi:diadenosine tetraphosphate (Ap4A) HIT family hydrolase
VKLISIFALALFTAITDVASLAKYIHAEIDTSVATNVKLYLNTDGVSTGIVNSTNANMLINFAVADAAAQSALVAALNDNTFGEYSLVDDTLPIATMEETASLISADIEIKSNETGTAYLFNYNACANTISFNVKFHISGNAGINFSMDIFSQTGYICNSTIGGSCYDINQGADTITGGANADILTGGAGADIFKYNAIADSTQTNADTITDFNVTADKLDLIDIITTATNGAITDVASLAKYIHAEIDTSVATNVKLYASKPEVERFVRVLAEISVLMAVLAVISDT